MYSSVIKVLVLRNNVEGAHYLYVTCNIDLSILRYVCVLTRSQPQLPTLNVYN